MRNLLLIIFTISAFAKAYTQEISPQTATVDIEKITASLALDFETKSIQGAVSITFTMLEKGGKVVLDAHNMSISKTNMTPLFEITATDSTIVFSGDFQAGNTYKALFEYSVRPEQAAYFVNNEGKDQFWTQGQGKYTSHWLPSIDDMNDKILFEISVHRSPFIYYNIASGLKDERNGIATPNTYNMKKPISSYLVALVAGDYKKKTATASSGIPLEYYYYPKDSLKVESTYRYSKQIFDFLETEIGVPYPWQVYKQVPVKDFLYAGMENASCTIFSDDFMVDDIGFIDRNYVNVNAHELAHQWFGNLVTETRSTHHWLHEGFATYYALLAERELFGDDYFYFKLFESAEQLRALSDSGKGQALVAPGGSSLTYYQKGAWALHVLREKVGKFAFAKAVTSYLKRHSFKNVTTEDFMTEVQANTELDLTNFKKNWLYQSAFQAEDALESLKKSDFMKQYFELQAGRVVPLESKLSQLIAAIDSGNDYLGQEAVYQLSGEPIRKTLTTYRRALKSRNILVRQAIAFSVEELPKELVIDFYSLLEDRSYETREQAFIKLWSHFQQQGNASSQRALLDRMDSQFDFADGTIRTLWLTLSLATPAYKPKKSLTRYKELISYTAPEMPFKRRQKAFQYLKQLDSFNKTSLRNLVEASVHHVWRFRENARNLLDGQLKNQENLVIIRGMENDFSEKEKMYLKRINVF